MFITFYELSADASAFEMMVWIMINGILQAIAAFAFVLLIIFAAAEQIFAFFHGRASYGYKHNAKNFAIGTTIASFCVMGAVSGAGYWSLLPAENQIVGWTRSLPVILVCVFMVCLAVHMMTKAWKTQRQFG